MKTNNITTTTNLQQRRVEIQNLVTGFGYEFYFANLPIKMRNKTINPYAEVVVYFKVKQERDSALIKLVNLGFLCTKGKRQHYVKSGNTESVDRNFTRTEWVWTLKIKT